MVCTYQCWSTAKNEIYRGVPDARIPYNLDLFIAYLFDCFYKGFLPGIQLEDLCTNTHYYQFFLLFFLGFYRQCYMNLEFKILVIRHAEGFLCLKLTLLPWIKDGAS